MVKGGKALGTQKNPKDQGTQLGKHLPEIFRSQRPEGTGEALSNMAPPSPTSDELSQTPSTAVQWGTDTPHHSLTTKADLSKLAEDIKGTITAAVADLRADIRVLTDKVTTLEKKEAHTTEAVRQLDKIAWAHNRHLIEMARNIEDLDNRGRRQNIRVRGMPEAIEAPQLEPALTAIFNSLLGRGKEEPIELIRAHRALRPRSQSDQNPRDVICCLANFKLKEEILSKARAQDEIDFNGTSVSLYQDLSPQTLQQRRALRPLLTYLRDKNIQYRWRFLFGLSASRNGRTYQLRVPDDLEDFCAGLRIPRIEVPEWFADYWIPDVSAHLEEAPQEHRPTRRDVSRSPRQRSPSSEPQSPHRTTARGTYPALQRFRR